MTIKEILGATKHRPWKLPSGSWKFYQEWNKVIFLHWRVDENELRGFVPDELELDVFEGKPWVSFVAFTMEHVHPRYAPAVQAISTFDEINIRTYVRRKGKAGVYFLSIEGGKRLSCAITKCLSGLPYRFSAMRRTASLYSSVNMEFGDRFAIDYRTAEVLHEKAVLDTWLTERYALFQDVHGSIISFDIHHAEWPLCAIELQGLELQYQRFERLLGGAPDKMHYSAGVQVVAWGKMQ